MIDQQKISPFNINAISNKKEIRKRIISVRRLLNDAIPNSSY